MSKSREKKKVVVTTAKQDNLKPTTSKLMNNPKGGNKSSSDGADLLYGWENYKWMIIGFALILIGMFLMMGGNNVSPDVWDENVIYSTRRTVLAPIVILTGLGVEVYAIFKNK